MKPILFNTEMVRAISDGRKCVTRRIIKPAPPPRAPGEVVKARHCVDRTWAFYVYDQKGEWMYSSVPYKQPYEVGDILYVRETWAITSGISGIADEGPVYMADFSEKDLSHLRDKHFRWRPSIHMPKDLARIFLRVTDVQAERLQNINADGAILEGVELSQNKMTARERENYYPALFAALWDTTLKPDQIKKYGWDANPWVWVIRFEQCEKLEEAR